MGEGKGKGCLDKCRLYMVFSFFCWSVDSRCLNLFLITAVCNAINLRLSLLSSSYLLNSIQRITVSAFCKPETVVGVRHTVEKKKDQSLPSKNDMKA